MLSQQASRVVDFPSRLRTLDTQHTLILYLPVNSIVSQS